MEALELRDGDDIEIRIAESRVFEVKKKPGRRELLLRPRKFRGKLPDDFRFDRDDANERS